jgi:hypothetical protein
VGGARSLDYLIQESFFLALDTSQYIVYAVFSGDSKWGCDMENTVTLEQALVLVRRLSPVDKARLIERIAPDIERELKAAQPTRRKSLRGLWQGLGITEADIAEARREMWGDFRDQAIQLSDVETIW